MAMAVANESAAYEVAAGHTAVSVSRRGDYTGEEGERGTSAIALNYPTLRDGSFRDSRGSPKMNKCSGLIVYTWPPPCAMHGLRVHAVRYFRNAISSSVMPRPGFWGIL
jgi:hypothetical protein